MKYSILHIEDNPGDITLMAVHLADIESFQCEVQSAGTIKDGLEAYKQNKHDIVLIDAGLV